MKVTAALVCALFLLTTFASIGFAEDRARSTPYRFEWVPYNTGVRILSKAAIAVPIYLKGSHHKLYAQLDTGSDATILYGNNLREWGIEIDSANNSLLEMSWTDENSIWPISCKVAWVDDGVPIDTTSDKLEDRVVGTIGADELSGKILVLDFPNQTYSVLADSNQIPESVKLSAEYVRTILHDSRLWIKVIVGADTLGWALYDTGSSETFLSLPLQEWQRATQRTGSEDDVVRDSIPSWSEYLLTLTAKAPSALHLGNITIESPTIQYTAFANEGTSDWRIIGNAPFYNDFIVIYDAKYNRIGFARSEK